MNILMRMIARNVPLHQWDSFQDTGDGKGFFCGGKKDEKVARIIFNSMSHPKAVELIAHDFGELTSQIRMELRELCNNGNASGNVRKGVQRLNEMLNGELLRKEKRDRFVSRRIETADGVRRDLKRVNPAVAGAQKKYASQ